MLDLRGLRADALKQRKIDGGTLTAEHLAALQARYDARNARYHVVASR